MMELEQLIIGCCFGEDQYKRVSFLEPSDFSNYPNKPYRDFFKLMKKANTENNVLSECIVKCEDDTLKALIMEQTTSLGMNYPERIAILLLEIRFKTLLSDLLVKLLDNAENPSERELLKESWHTLNNTNTDVFDLSDHLLEYMGNLASDFTKDRINAFIEYRNKRGYNAKKVINELR